MYGVRKTGWNSCSALASTAYIFDDYTFGTRLTLFQPAGLGELRLALLALLHEGPKHGYELMKELESRSGGIYRASAGSVYPTLQQLEDEGLARSKSSDGKRIYQLTDDGEWYSVETYDVNAKTSEFVVREWNYRDCASAGPTVLVDQIPRSLR